MHAHRILNIITLTLAMGGVAAGSCLGQNAAATNTSADDRALRTPQQESSRNVGSVARAPLNDLNLVHQSIPPILEQALADPYAPVSHPTCRVLAMEVGKLDAVLGRDFDDPNHSRKAGLAQSGGEGLSLMHSVAESFIPFDGVVRTLSGAQRRDQKVLSAINAGDARRAYLKGLGERGQCAAPAAPRGHRHR